MTKGGKKWVKTIMLTGFAAAITFSLNTGVFAKEIQNQPTSYRTVTEIKDWGAAVTKVIVDLGRPVPKGNNGYFQSTCCKIR
jgi:hypothetical protein